MKIIKQEEIYEIKDDIGNLLGRILYNCPNYFFIQHISTCSRYMLEIGKFMKKLEDLK